MKWLCRRFLPGSSLHYDVCHSQQHDMIPSVTNCRFPKDNRCKESYRNSLDLAFFQQQNTVQNEPLKCSEVYFVLQVAYFISVPCS